MAPIRVALYSPDRAIVYDGRTPDAVGVGGGITARLSMVEALAALGAAVTAYTNCAAPISHAGVRYEPVDAVTRIDTDILIAISTGGALSLAPLREITLTCRLRIVWVQGVPQPADLEAVDPHFYYVASNFLRDVCVDRWGVPAHKVFVCYNGLKQTVFRHLDADAPARDRFALAYIGPPEKGLAQAVAIVRRLREHDSRYRLHVFGGARLWGRATDEGIEDPCVVSHGLLGQAALIPELYRCEYLLAPQAMEEGFGIAVQEAKRAGMVVIASAVGALPELIDPDVDGYLVSEPYTGQLALDRFVSLVLALSNDDERRARVRERARATPWDWETGGRTWMAHWETVNGGTSEAPPAWLALPDGLHSTLTGYYQPVHGPVAPMPSDAPLAGVLIAGYYGHGNAGDEAIASALVGQLRTRFPGIRITMISGAPEETRTRHQVDTVGERDIARIIDAVSSAALVIIGGGGLLHDQFGCDSATILTPAHWGLAQSATVALLADALDRPLALCGVGVGPLETEDGRRLVRLIVERADRITVRDQSSADLLRQLGVSRPDVLVTSDLAFLLGARPQPIEVEPTVASHAPSQRHGGPVIAVAVRHWRRNGAESWEDIMASALDTTIDTHQASVAFVPFQAGYEGDLTDDAAAAERVRRHMRRSDAASICPHELQWRDVHTRLAGADVVVAMRLHAAILAATAGTPVVALAYDPKVRHVMTALGPAAPVVDLETLEAQDLCRHIAAALAEGPQRARTLRTGAQLLRASAAQNLVVLSGLLRGARRVDRPHSHEWSALTDRVLVHQARRAATHEAGVAFLKGELGAMREALEAGKTEHAELSARLADRTADLTWLGGELQTLRSDLEWRPEHSYRRLRRTLRRYRRGVGRRLAAAFVVIGAPPARVLHRLYTTAVPEAARAAVARACSRRLMSWPAYTFDRYRRRRAAVYGRSLAGTRVASVPGLVTIVLPAYNGAPMMREAIDSVLAQTYRHLELIVVDDGSTDDTGRIANDYARTDGRIRVIHQTNQKLPRALSNGFRAARGEFLTWTSCDNRLMPEFVERMVQCLERHPDWDAAYANLDIIGDDGRPLRNTTFYGPDQHPPGSEHIRLPRSTETLNVVANNSVGAAFLYRNRVACLLGDYSRYRFVLEDYDYWMRVNATMTLRHADFAESLYEYRFHDSSLTSRWDEFDMLGHRDRLMVFEDFRRDFLLAPMVWVIDGDASEGVSALRARASAAGHVAFTGEFDLADLPSTGVPLIRVHVTTDPLRAAADTPPMPDWALRVCVATSETLPDVMPEEWDLCCTTAAPSALPPLSRPFQGWLAAPDTGALLQAIDIRAKSDQLARIEAIAETGPAPSLRATVVICTRSASDGLSAAVDSIARQSLPADAWELIVVDNEPAEGAIRACLDALATSLFAPRQATLRVVSCPIDGLSAARNAGIAEARGEVVAFIDDDAVADEHWLQAICDGFANRPHVGVVGGHIRLRGPEPPPAALQPGWEKYWSHFVTEHPGFVEVQDWRHFPWGANWSARRGALRAVGGFRTQYGRVGNNYWGGEELVTARLIQRLGFAVAIEPRAIVDHQVNSARFSLEHVRRTLTAGYHVGHLAVRDGYLPGATSAVGAALWPLLTSHVDRAVPEGRYRRLDAWFRKKAQVGVLGRVLADMLRRTRRPFVAGRS